MTTITLDLSTETYRRLKETAVRLGKAPQVVIEEWVAERLTPAVPEPLSERDRARQLLAEAGLLSEPSPGLVPPPEATPEEIVAAFSRLGGKPLSEIVIEQRGPKI